MPLFVCSKCSVIENTALCGYWYNKEHLCSQCDPSINKWHNIFKRTFFNKVEWQEDKDGFVSRKV